MRNGRDAARAVAALATRFGGVASADTLVQAGLSRATIRRRVRAGTFIDLGADVFAIGHEAVSDGGWRQAALLAAGEGSALSHWTAAFLWGLVSREPPVIHVSARGRSTRRSCRKVVIHRPRALPADDVRRRDGQRLTTIPRTLLDLAPLVTDADLRRMIEAAITARHADPTKVRRYAVAAGRRPGATRLVRACEAVTGPARSRSDLETAFRTFCEERGLPPYEMNVPFERWELDGLWRKHGVAVELDWYRYHGARSNYRSDRRKGLAIERAGLHLVRVAGEDLEEVPDEVFFTLDAVLQRAAASSRGGWGV